MAHVPDASTYSTSMFSDDQEIDRLVEQMTQEMQSAASNNDFITAGRIQSEINVLKERKARTVTTDSVDNDKMSALCTQMQQHSPWRKPSSKASSSVVHSPMKEAGPPSKSIKQRLTLLMLVEISQGSCHRLK